MATPLRPAPGRGPDPRSLASRPRCPRGPRAAPGDQQRPRWEVRGRVETGGRRKPSTRLTFSEHFPPPHPGRGSRAAAATLPGSERGATRPRPVPPPPRSPRSSAPGTQPPPCPGRRPLQGPLRPLPPRAQGCSGWTGRKEGRDTGRPGSVGGGRPAGQRAPRRAHAGGRTPGDRRLSQPRRRTSAGPDLCTEGLTRKERKRECAVM